jgi:uroporphyrinogen decarboxylase
VSDPAAKRNRLQAAIAGDVADRLPVALWRHFPVDDQDPDRLAAATVDFQARYDFDFVKLSPASSFCLKDWGVEDEWQGDPEGTRANTRRVIETSQDWSRLVELDPHQGWLGAQLRCLNSTCQRLGEATPVVQTVFSPLAQAKNLAGKTRLLEHLHSDPERVLVGLEAITRTTLAFIEAARACGMAGVFYAVQHASFAIFDMDAYARFGLAFDRRIAERLEGLWLNVLHLHGLSLIFEVAERLPFQVVNWHAGEAGPDLADARGRLSAAVCGGLDQAQDLVLGTPDDIRRRAAQAIETVGGRGLILGAGCVVPTIAPHGNLLAARHAVDFA